MKEVHKYDLLIVKVGTFYHLYGKDAYIVAFLFNYQIKKIEDNINTVGFPAGALNKVEKTLEDKSIGYVVLDKSANYEVIEENLIKKSDDSYVELYNKSHKYFSRKNKIDEIYDYLISSINEDKIKAILDKMEEIIYE